MERGGEAWSVQQPEDLASEALDGIAQSNVFRQKVEPERRTRLIEAHVKNIWQAQQRDTLFKWEIIFYNRCSKKEVS